MDNFYQLANEEHEIKLRNERLIKEDKNNTGESVYTMFCVWCNAFNKGNGKNDPEVFGKFLKQELIELNFHQKKHIAEKHFNWIYDFDLTNNKWNIKRKVS